MSKVVPYGPFIGKRCHHADVYRVLFRLKEGAGQTQISRQLGFSRKRIRGIIQNCVDLGYLELDYYAEIKRYKFTQKGEAFFIECKKRAFQGKVVPSSICVSDGPFRTHSLRFKLKILRQNPHADFSGEFEYRKKNPANWEGSCFIITFPTAMTVEVNPEWVVVNFHEFQSRPNELMNRFFEVVWRGLLQVHGLFQKKYSILLDISAPKLVNAHIANERPDLDDKLPVSAKVSVDLGRSAQVVFSGDLRAKAWFDRSKGRGRVDVESNDLTYAELLLLMPETVDKLFRELAPVVGENSVQVAEFSKQLALHLAAIEGIKAGVEAEGVALRESRAAIQELRDAVRALRGVPVADVDEGGRLGYG